MNIRSVIKKIEKENVSVADFVGLTDKQATKIFEYYRWGINNQDCFCPNCGNCKNIYSLSNGRYRCGDNDCKSTFSVFTNTLLSNHSFGKNKMGKVAYAIALMSLDTTTSKMQLMTSLSYQSLHTLQHKIRMVSNNVNQHKLQGIVEMDGVYFHRFNTKYKKDSRVAIFVRQRSKKKGEGASRTLVFVCERENTNAILKFALENIELGSEIHTDSHYAYRCLEQYFIHKKVNHSREYVSRDGVNNNQCESLNGIARKSIDKDRRGVSKQYLYHYLNEIAHRSNFITRNEYGKRDKKRENARIINDLFRRCMHNQAPIELIHYGKNDCRVVERLYLPIKSCQK